MKSRPDQRRKMRLNTPLVVKKLKTYEVGIDTATFVVKAIGKGDAFRIAVKQYREDNNLAENICVMTNFVRERAIEIGATS